MLLFLAFRVPVYKESLLPVLYSCTEVRLLIISSCVASVFCLITGAIKLIPLSEAVALYIVQIYRSILFRHYMIMLPGLSGFAGGFPGGTKWWHGDFCIEGESPCTVLPRCQFRALFPAGLFSFEKLYPLGGRQLPSISAEPL